MNGTNERFGLFKDRRSALLEMQPDAVTHDAGQVGAVLLEFDASGRLTFATREAQALLGFALEPLWGRSVAAVLIRISQLGRVERVGGARIVRAPTAQLTATEQALGVLHASLELRLTSQPLERLTLRFRGAN